MSADPTTPEPTDDDPTAELPTDELVEAVADPDTGEELGEVSGGGQITDLGGDAPSS